jgi:hypothetical protein
MTEGVRTWRLAIPLVIPKREPRMVDEHGVPGFPPKLEFTSRIVSETATIAGLRVGLRPWIEEPLPIEISGSFDFRLEVVELCVVVEAGTIQDALAGASPVVEEVLESVSFETQYALRPLMTRVVDVTAPVEAGEMREFVQLSGFPIPAFLQSVALGHIAVADATHLPSASQDLERHVAAARGWYVKSLSTPFTADQFIFLWIALEILWSKSDHKTAGPFKCRHGHVIEACPTCKTPLERPVFGLGIQSFLTKESGLSEEEASKLWKARQIMHGAVPFDSAQMRDLPVRVQVLRAAVVAALKAQLGIPPEAAPLVVAGAFALDPSGTGASGEASITADDLSWP